MPLYLDTHTYVPGLTGEGVAQPTPVTSRSDRSTA